MKISYDIPFCCSLLPFSRLYQLLLTDTFSPSKSELIELSTRLQFSSVDSLTRNASSVRSHFQEIEKFLPEELQVALNSMAFMEYHRYNYLKARRNIDDWEVAKRLQEIAEKAFNDSEVEVTKLTSATERRDEAKNRLPTLPNNGSIW